MGVRFGPKEAAMIEGILSCYTNADLRLFDSFNVLMYPSMLFFIFYKVVPYGNYIYGNETGTTPRGVVIITHSIFVILFRILD